MLGKWWHFLALAAVTSAAMHDHRSQDDSKSCSETTDGSGLVGRTSTAHLEQLETLEAAKRAPRYTEMGREVGSPS